MRHRGLVAMRKRQASILNQEARRLEPAHRRGEHLAETRSPAIRAIVLAVCACQPALTTRGMRSEINARSTELVKRRAPSRAATVTLDVGKAKFEEPPNGPYAHATASHFVQGEARSTAVY